MTHIPRVVAAAKATLAIRRASSSRRPSARIAVPSRFTRRASSSWPARRRSSASCDRLPAPVVAALKEYQKFLENDLLPRAKGEWRLGKEKFARKLELELDAGITAEEVLREAERKLTASRARCT